jgi:thiamine-phosphate pyrophosphorylase
VALLARPHSAGLRSHSKPMSKNRSDSVPPTPQLYLVTTEIEDATAFALPLRLALEATGVAAVLLRLADADERSLITRAKALAPVVQEKGAPLILDGRPDLVARAGADGAQMAGIEALAGAIETLKPKWIAGAAGLQSRHDAMLAAELGADYILFGEPGPDRLHFDTLLERVAWWAEVFETPCVAFASQLDEITPLAAAGADFVAVGDCIWADPRGPAAALLDAAGRLLAESPA